MRNYELLIPGPVMVDEAVMEALAQPVPAHYGAEWVATYRSTVTNLQQIFQTQNDLFLLFGPGTAALDAAIGSLLAPGQQMLIPNNGFFGARMTTVAQSHGIEVVAVEAPLGQPVSAEDVAAQLDRHRDVAAVGVVHHETSTGVLNPLREITRVARERNCLVVVDAVSSLGGMSLPVDEWGIDICVTVANKCLGSVTGVAPVSVSRRAWKAIDQNPRQPGWYLNLRTWRGYAQDWAEWHPHPTTMPGNVILALQAATRQILAEGLERRFERHAQAARRMRDGLQALGFKMFVDDTYASPVTTAVRLREGMSYGELADYLREEHGMMISDGIAELSGKIFRVGHMGHAADVAVIDRFLAAVKDFVTTC